MRRCDSCRKMKDDMAFKGIKTDTCRICSFDLRDKSSPKSTYKVMRKCLKCDKDFMALMNKRLCNSCKATF